MTSTSDEYVQCKNCGVNLNPKNVQRHKTKCLTTSKQKKSIKKSKKKSSGEFDTQHNPLKERAEERRLDGARDYFKIRENGRFGSYSSLDDMDDESFA